jgi:hypothetical protein
MYSVSAPAPAIEHSVPRFAGAERKIQHWTQTERGRHSAAIEVPDLLVATAASSSAPCAKPRPGGPTSSPARSHVRRSTNIQPAV